MQSSPPISNQSRPLVEDEDVSAPSFNGLAAAEMGTVNRLDSASESPQEATTSTQGPVLKGGLAGIDSLRVSDYSYRIAPLYSEMATRCQHIMQKNAESSFKKLTDATGLNDPRHSEVEDKFAHAFQDYFLFLHLQESIYRFNKPSQKTINGFVTHAKRCPDDGISQCSKDMREWVSLHPSEPFEDFLYDVLQTSLGRKLLGPLLTRIEKRQGVTYTDYSVIWLGRIRLGIQNFAIGIFFGVPVTILSLGLVSAVASIGIFVVFVSAASILLASFFCDPRISSAVIIGYASVLANNLRG